MCIHYNSEKSFSLIPCCSLELLPRSQVRLETGSCGRSHRSYQMKGMKWSLIFLVAVAAANSAVKTYRRNSRKSTELGCARPATTHLSAMVVVEHATKTSTFAVYATSTSRASGSPAKTARNCRSLPRKFRTRFRTRGWNHGTVNW